MIVKLSNKTEKSPLIPIEILQLPDDQIIFKQTALPNDWLGSDHVRIETKFCLQTDFN